MKGTATGARTSVMIANILRATLNTAARTLHYCTSYVDRGTDRQIKSSGLTRRMSSGTWAEMPSPNGGRTVGIWGPLMFQ